MSSDSPNQEFTEVANIDVLRDNGRTVAMVEGRPVALFHHEGEVYALDNRCPHMGFPLSKGSLKDGLLTCDWHHARFELAQGDTLDIWADDVQTFPTRVQDGTVYVDPNPEPDVPPETHWRNRLADGLAENLSLVAAKAVIHLDHYDEGFVTPLETAVDFGTQYRADGWGRGMTTLGAMANLYGDLAHDEKLRAMIVGVTEVADNCDGEPPRFEQYALDNDDLSQSRLKSWFRDTCDVRDSTGAERCLRTAANTLAREDLVEMLVAAGTDHIYMNNSHTVDFINKAVETLDHVGWDRREAVLATVVDAIADASRGEETSTWTRPVDVAQMCFDAAEDLPEMVAAGAGKDWNRPDGFIETLLSADPHRLDEALRDAVASGASTEQLAHAIAVTALRRVAHFGTGNEFSDWNTVHHTVSFANAVDNLARRTNAPDVYKACWQGAMSVYLDRFLNQPRASVPEPGAGADGDPAELRERLLAVFDEQGGVDEAARVVGGHFDAGGDPAALKRTMGEGLLREDADFHTLQNVEAGFRQFELAESERERRLALIAPARYMAAHFPTRREDEQTVTIAERLFEGESIHKGVKN
jgi:nitrite reductase/ring-hydroxylating ferredoxin subunit|uniref:Sugar ABC transporter permease protein n=1 Tax=uncultured haloarchaeon TaxID=160804 RepID=Q2LGX5_9EURY|nr:sugar ABC transporter permease protein [uncultured haloarchaeon]